jgi:hypothetical protein
MQNIKITTYPQSNPLTLAGAKLHLNILDDSFDVLIQSYLDSASMLLYKETNILIEGVATGFLIDATDFTVPVAEVDTLAIYYYNAANARTLLSSDDYTVNFGAFTDVRIDVVPNTYTDRIYPYEVEITTLGANDPMITQGLRMIVGDFFRNRESNEVGAIKKVSRSTKWQLDLLSKRFYL